jgi:hypothetical protein
MSPLWACGNCVYYALWQQFPPISSWAVLVPLWFVALAAIRTWHGTAITAIPPVYVAIPLVLAVWLFAPGTFGPMLGSWIPVCAVIGTVSVWRRATSPAVRQAVSRLSVSTGLLLTAFGVHDYIEYAQMPDEQRSQFVPTWERPRVRQTD